MADITTYKLVYSTTATPANCSTGSTLYEGVNNYYEHSSLNIVDTYFYRVCTLDNSNPQNLSQGISNSIGTLTNITIPSTIIEVAATLGNVLVNGQNSGHSIVAANSAVSIDLIYSIGSSKTYNFRYTKFNTGYATSFWEIHCTGSDVINAPESTSFTAPAILGVYTIKYNTGLRFCESNYIANSANDFDNGNTFWPAYTGGSSAISYLTVY